MEFLILLGLIALVVWYVISTYNGLVAKRTMVEEGFSGIDVQLKRRTDLIPNLVETVKGYMTHEQSTLEKVTEMRTRAQNAVSPQERFAAEAGIGKLLGNIMAVAENYPNLQASSSFVNLQGELSGIEEQIQMARRYYNGTVRELNMMIDQFPSNIIANHFKFTKAAFFEIENEEERAVQKVSFK